MLVLLQKYLQQVMVSPYSVLLQQRTNTVAFIHSLVGLTLYLFHFVYVFWLKIGQWSNGVLFSKCLLQGRLLILEILRNLIFSLIAIESEHALLLELRQLHCDQLMYMAEWVNFINTIRHHIWLIKLISQMSIQSANTSYSVGLQTLQVPRNTTQAGKHLINTSKVVKGHKLKTQDFIRLQLMRFRYCSPVKYEEQIENNLLHMSKTTSFAEKYQPLQCEIDKNELQQFIIHQREKHSRQVINQIKLFATQQPISKQINKANFTIKVKPATSQEHRKVLRKDETKMLSLNKTQHIIKPSSSSKVEFFSQNLGTKMNNYMNQMIVPVENIEEQQKPAQILDSHFKQRRQRQFLSGPGKDGKASHIAYIKQLKKKLRNKYQSTIRSNQSPIKPHYTLKDFALIDSKNSKALQDQTFYSILSKDSNQSNPSSGKLALSKQAEAQKILPYHFAGKVKDF